MPGISTENTFFVHFDRAIGNPRGLRPVLFFLLIMKHYSRRNTGLIVQAGKWLTRI
jgi:hypothetical protein